MKRSRITKDILVFPESRTASLANSSECNKIHCRSDTRTIFLSAKEDLLKRFDACCAFEIACVTSKLVKQGRVASKRPVWSRTSAFGPESRGINEQPDLHKRFPESRTKAQRAQVSGPIARWLAGVLAKQN